MSLDFLYHAWFSFWYLGYHFGTWDIILLPSAVKFSDRQRGFCLCYVSRYNHFVPSLRPLGRLIKKLQPFKQLKALHFGGFH